ncbi:glutathione ABC transporter periplasmic binding protein [Rhodovastum atsumiense]|uniref:Glutathione-binding protein GsiB n=1 Tax=Rhodovastum atsumiense TaxID=504468 RepID=A0A5M6ISU4_9PROT|nr:glutathione ABC transporter substrate-binding protein [Rhodovastum atsumiense]KAA5611281.1 glutathione ABC transporter substrate-binding protein [Rhodovastum atsumiense]CAH2601745.1 glutathione ABC transporter periplasmic binding protein [Rhodovastum atsumiense]
MSSHPDVSRRALLGTVLGLAAVPAMDGLLASPARAAAPAGDLVVGVPDNLTGLDPADINDTLSQSACRLVYEGLYGFDKDMKLVPMLAESYVANDTATEFTFKLQKGVVFHDGTPFDAAAVKANFDRLTDPNVKLKRSSMFSMVERTEVIDPATVKVVLKSPFGAFVPTIAHAAAMMVSPKAVAQYGKEIGRNPVGTGPFTFVSWNADTLKVVANPHYRKPGLPKVKSVTFRSVPENGSRIAMLQTGEAHFIYPMPPEMVKVVQNNKAVTIINEPSIVVRYVTLNVTKKPFNDVRVRQALNYAIDRQAFNRVVFNGFAQPLDSAIPPGLGFYVKQTPYTHDVAKAKKLLAEAGYPNGFETEIWGANNSLSMRMMQVVQQQLAAVGIKVTISGMEVPMLYARLYGAKTPAESEMQMQMGGWSSSTGDADWGLRPLLAGSAFPPALFNTGYYDSPEVNRAIDAALTTADPAKRAAAYADAQKHIWEDAPWVFLVVEPTLAAQSKKLSGFYQMPDRGLLPEAAELTN